MPTIPFQERTGPHLLDGRSYPNKKPIFGLQVQHPVGDLPGTGPPLHGRRTVSRQLLRTYIKFVATGFGRIFLEPVGGFLRHGTAPGHFSSQATSPVRHSGPGVSGGGRSAPGERCRQFWFRGGQGIILRYCGIDCCEVVKRVRWDVPSPSVVVDHVSGFPLRRRCLSSDIFIIVECRFPCQNAGGDAPSLVILTRAVQYLSDMSATPANKSAATPLPLRNAFIINPPDGPYPYSGLQVFGYVVIGFFTALSLVVCGLRVYSRRLIKGLYIGKFIARPKTSR